MQDHIRAITFCLCVFLLIPTAFTQTRRWTRKERILKAVMLVNIIRYTKFDQELSRDNFEVCILGSNPFGEYLNEMEKNKIGNKTIQTKLVQNEAVTLDECNAIFISSEVPQRVLSKVIQQTKSLTISERKDFLQDGGMVNIINLGSTISFKVNRTKAKEKGIDFSSHLLRLARKVL